MNQVTMTGNLTKDPQKIQTQSNKPMTKFTIGVNENKADDTRGTLFLDCITFDNMATNCQNYLYKGAKVLVIGKLQVKTFNGQDGKEYTRLEVLANNVEFLSKKKETADDPYADLPFPEEQHRRDKENNIKDDDLPF